MDVGVFFFISYSTATQHKEVLALLHNATLILIYGHISILFVSIISIALI